MIIDAEDVPTAATRRAFWTREAPPELLKAILDSMKRDVEKSGEPEKKQAHEF